jgi:HEAT repeat protein
MIAKILSTEKDPFLRSEAIASLIVYPNRLSRKLLLSEIKERRERSFHAALVVLGSVGDETCISVLRDVVVKEEVDWVRERAKESLVKIQKRMTKDEDAH